MRTFTCPRCGTPAADEYYGPCASCRDELRSRYAGGARRVEAPEYEPKLNVVPNAVASKDAEP